MFLRRRNIPVAKLGPLGERRAAWFYRLRGYRIVGRNVRLRSGEIDLVVRRGAILVVAEVKTRQSRTAGEGHEAVDSAKRARLVRLGDEYLARTREPLQLRYDVLSLFWNGRRFEVSYYPDAFRPVSNPLRPWTWRV
ncbi:MAG: YraN family protein [Thermoanaerobaculia bacterium]